jgi:2,4-dienoyl-CoA reductase-like NADH-dependent reductase (Old Yellow Enzyme family)
MRRIDAKDLRFLVACSVKAETAGSRAYRHDRELAAPSAVLKHGIANSKPRKEVVIPKKRGIYPFVQLGALRAVRAVSHPKAGISLNGGDMVASGRSYVANPDLIERLATGAPRAEIGWETVYASGPHGYSDYRGYATRPPDSLNAKGD